MFVVQCMNFAALEHPWSTIVKMALEPSNSGKLVIKSMATTWNDPYEGLTGIGCNGAFW